MRENQFSLKKGKKQTILNGNYSGRGLRRWHSASSKSPLHNLELAGRGIGLYMNADKAKYMRFNKIIV